MKRLLLTIAAVAGAAAANLSPASAGEPQAPAATAWPAADGPDSRSETRTSHYEWQYHYAGRHARYEGHWVRVR